MKIDEMEKYAVFSRVNKFADAIQTERTNIYTKKASMRLSKEKKCELDGNKKT